MISKGLRPALLAGLDRAARRARQLARTRGWRFPRLAAAARRAYLALIPRKPISTKHGFSIYVHPERDAINDVIARDRAYEPATATAIEASLRPGGLAVDAGAHVGFFTLLMAQRVGSGGRVHAFEPAPKNFELLERNVDWNRLENVTLHQRAVWSRSETLRLNIQPSRTGGHSIGARSGEGVEIEAVSLDDVFGKAGASVDLIKLDVEGAEIEALEGMAGVIDASPDLTLILEWYPHLMRRGGVDPDRLMELLTGRYGFRVHQCLREDRAFGPEYLSQVRNGHVNLLLRKDR